MSIGKETTATALGKEWHFSRWDKDVWDALSDEARKRLPDPIDTMLAKIDKVSLKDADTIRQLRIQDTLAFTEWQKRKDENPKTCGPQPLPMEASYKPLADWLAEKARIQAGMYL